ncbi:MAG: hypothetical protein ABJN69_15945 [Hellea sp.]
MAFEDFLRSIPLVQKHIMRTRLLMHENRKFREFLEDNGIKADDVLSSESDVDGEGLAEGHNFLPNTDIETAFKTVSTSLRAEQKRAANLEASLYVLQIDYNNLLLQPIADEAVKVKTAAKAKPKAAAKKRKPTKT